MNGLIYDDSAVKIAAITDGTSNTFLFGERAKFPIFKTDPPYAVSDGSWNTGQYYDTMVSTFYPPNIANSSTPIKSYYYYAPGMGSSLHPGRAEFRVCRRLGALHQEFDQLVDIRLG